MNSATFSQEDMPDGTWYSAAGLISEGIEETVRQDMAQQFPGVEPNVGASGGGAGEDER